VITIVTVQNQVVVTGLLVIVKIADAWRVIWKKL